MHVQTSIAERGTSRRVRPAHPLKVVHVVLSLNTGGLEWMLLRLLRHTDRSRFTPVVVALDEPGVLAPGLEKIGVPLTVIRRGPGLDPVATLRLARFFDQQEAAIVHTHNAAPHFYGAVAAKLARRRPRVVHTKHGRNLPDIKRKVLLNHFSATLTDRLVAVSDDAAKVVTDIERVPSGKVMTILNGVDTDEYRPGGDRLAARRALGVPEHGFHVGCVARLATVKDHGTLLSAFVKLREKRPDAHLTLIGDGPEKSKLLAQRDALGLGASVTFAGERSDVAPLLPAFDVFALSSVSEGISLTLLEAAAAGLPIVATNVGGNREVVVDGETGILVPPRDPARFADALDRVAIELDRSGFGAAGRERVKARFSVEEMARAYHDLYAELLAAR